MNNPYNGELTADITRAGLVLRDSDNQALLPLVKAGDHDARQQMIGGNLPLVISIVEGKIDFAPQLAYLRDDMTSAGYTGLTKAVNRIKRLSDRAKVTSYLSVAIRRDIKRLACRRCDDLRAATESTSGAMPKAIQLSLHVSSIVCLSVPGSRMTPVERRTRVTCLSLVAPTMTNGPS